MLALGSPFTMKLFPDNYRQHQTRPPHLTLLQLVGVSKWNAAPSVLLTIVLPENHDSLSFTGTRHGHLI
jgi:hypothetical protein